MNYLSISYDDMLNGDGLRCVLWVAGCEHQCKGCHNQHTWNASQGNPITQETIDEIVLYLKRDYVQGLTLSGGDPLLEQNREDMLALVKEIKERVPEKDIWMYTGYLYEDLVKSNALEILQYVDVLLDGPFILDKRSPDKPWVGSSNQRVINTKLSLNSNQIVLKY